MAVFTDRVEAGRCLAEQLEYLRGQDIVVLGLPRGGVPVAFQVAEVLDAPLDVIVVRKLGVPFQPELAMGAIGEGGVRVLNSHVLAITGVTDEELRAVERRERAELDTRVARFRSGRPRLTLKDRIAVIVDDGIATGSTARVACQVARRLGALRVILAVPVAPADTVHEISEADEVVCVSTPRIFEAVGLHYRDFTATTDREVSALLDAAALRRGDDATSGQAVDSADDFDDDVEIPVDATVDATAAHPVTLRGHLHLPERVTGVVVFAHGSGSSRHSPRNRYVADVLYQAGLGTLLLDLLTPEEELERANVFDIELLARRLAAATRWLAARSDTSSARVGYFGASTGAAAALWAAADVGGDISAVVSRGGRPDLAGARLTAVTAPTLLIVGGDDEMVLELNRQAQALLRCPSHLAVVPGATHLFEEPGTLQDAAVLARDWFVRLLVPAGTERATDVEQ